MAKELETELHAALKKTKWVRAVSRGVDDITSNEVYARASEEIAAHLKAEGFVRAEDVLMAVRNHRFETYRIRDKCTYAEQVGYWDQYIKACDNIHDMLRALTGGEK